MTRPAKQQQLLLPPRASRLAAVAARSCTAVALQQDDESSSSKRIVTFSSDPPRAIPSYWQDYEEVQSLARQVWWTKAERGLFGKTARTLAWAYQGAAKMTPSPTASTTCLRRPLLLHQRKVHRQLQDAIEDAQFEAHYQPKAVALSLIATPLYLPWTVRGLEALICPILCRWRRQHVHGALALSDSDNDDQTMAEWCRQSSRPSVLLAQRLAIADAGQTSLLSSSPREDTQEESTTTTPCLPPRVVSPETIPPEKEDMQVVPRRPVGLFAPDGRKRPRAGCSLLEHPQRRLLHKRRRLLWVR